MAFHGKHAKKGISSLLWIWLGLAAVIGIIVALVLVSRHNSRSFASSPPQKPSVAPPSSVIIGGRVLPVQEDLPKNDYSPESFTTDERRRVTYSGEGVTYGLDASSYQGDIDWQAVKEDGIDFAILRCGMRGTTQGLLYEDETFQANLSGAIEAGLDVGVYFFSQAITEEEAREEAQYVLERIDGTNITYPVYFDWEYCGTDTRGDWLDPADLGTIAMAFCGEIRKAGYDAGIYFNSYQGYLHYNLQDFQHINLWLAEYDDVPEFYYDFQMWQYSNTGSVNGIDYDVDLNICFAPPEK